jgi:hypothetical protein
VKRGEIRWYTFRLPDKRRPVLILTRNDVIDRLNEIIVIPATRTIRGLTTEVVLTCYLSETRWAEVRDALLIACAFRISEDQAINAAKQIRALDAGVKFSPQFAGTKVPSFEEALALAHGKIGVYGGAGFLRKVQAIGSSLKIVPEAYSAATLEKLLGDLKPRVVALDAGDFTDAAIMVAKRAGVEIYVDRLGSADNASAWQDAVDRGAAGIQTDRPAELAEYLRSHQLRKPD